MDVPAAVTMKKENLVSYIYYMSSVRANDGRHLLAINRVATVPAMKQYGAILAAWTLW